MEGSGSGELPVEQLEEPSAQRRHRAIGAPDDCDLALRSSPEGPVEQGLGWKNSFGSGAGGDTYTSGIEGAWTTDPVNWDNSYFDNLFNYEWEQVKSPAGHWQWHPKDGAAAGTVPDAHDPSKKHPPMMLTTDLSLKMDPIYAPIKAT